jgi:hypothetical protein
MTKRLFLAAAAALALAAPAGAQVNLPGSPNEEGASIQATGIVQAATQQDAFTLRVRGMSFRVLYQPGPGQRRQEVRTGDRVRVNGDLTSADQIRADSVMVLQRGGGGGGNGPRQSRTVTGTIRRIDRETKEMRVATSDGVVRVQWNENTEFQRDTTRSGPREFFVGDAVRIVGRRGTDNEMVARRVLFGGRAGWANGGVGEIVGIDARAREIDVDFDGEVWTVRLGSAQLRRRDQRIQIDDLRIGQDVRVSGSGRGTRAVDASIVEVVRTDRD